MANRIIDKLKEALNTTPKAARWLLLIAAFVVVLVLLFLLMKKPEPIKVPGVKPDKNIQLEITPATTHELSDITVGTKGNQTFKITATDDAVIDSVDVKNSVNGFTFTSCAKQNGFAVNKDIPCVVNVTFAPSKPDISDSVTLVIKWHDKGDSADINQKTDEIIVPVSSVSAFQQPEPEPDPEPEPEPEPDPDPEPEPIVPHPVFPVPVQPEKEPAPVKRAEKCSDFAMPGFSTSGVQIGWIKPKDGRYEFHPFADTECNNPTGIYDPNTGIITSIDGKGKKIGTDADHIGGVVSMDTLPKLKNKPGNVAPRQNTNKSTGKGTGSLKGSFVSGEGLHLIENKINKAALAGSAEDAESVYNSMPYDRTFILRQFKPIPATIVSEVRADPSVYGCNGATCDGGSGIPVRATVDRNVYSDNGRTIIIPTGTLLMGYLTGKLPGPYKSIGRMEIKWYQFIRPDGVEFNFGEGQDPYSADSQGRVGVPGYGSTDYIEQMVMPLLTAIVPAAVNMIAPIADTFVNQIDLDNNTVVQSGTVRSSELAKNEVISAWNQVAQKLIVDALDNTVPPFSIAAGTRITVYSPVDLIATCGDSAEEAGSDAGKKCAFHEYSSKPRRPWASVKDGLTIDPSDSSWTGQVRSFDLKRFCTDPDSKTGKVTIKEGQETAIQQAGYDYRTVLAYCQSLTYQAVNQAKYEAYYDNKLKTGIQGVDEDGKAIKLEVGDVEYNKQVLGLQYAKDEDGKDTDIIINPFDKNANAPEPVGSLDCDGQAPDQYGCCPGETYEDMGESYVDEDGSHFACCPAGGGDCFPPLKMN